MAKQPQPKGPVSNASERLAAIGSELAEISARVEKAMRELAAVNALLGRLSALDSVFAALGTPAREENELVSPDTGYTSDVLL